VRARGDGLVLDCSATQRFPAIAMTPPPLRIGVAGLGRAFTFMLPTFMATRVPSPPPIRCGTARAFAADSAVVRASQALCADPDVDVVYVATPHGDHAHACWRSLLKQHVLVEKPMAVTSPLHGDDRRAARAPRNLIVGHSHSFDAPIARTREITGANSARRSDPRALATDHVPRAPARAAHGRRQRRDQPAAHQFDIVRLLGAAVQSVARPPATGMRAAHRGAYSALLTFAGGAFATCVYSGYAHSWRRADGRHRRDGRRKPADAYGSARRRCSPRPTRRRAALKAARNYGGAAYVPAPAAPLAHQHFGRARLLRARRRRPPTGVHVWRCRATFERCPRPRCRAGGDRRAVARRRRCAAGARWRMGARNARAVPRGAGLRTARHRARAPARG
jgi:phthalate 4,5-cis-dihydrodiol dehydrogenase